MRNFPKLMLICLVVFCQSCMFDQDDEFYMRTKAAFFLVEDPLNSQRSIVRIDSTGLENAWELNLDIPAGAVSDISGINNELWISNKIDRLIYQTDPASARITEAISTGDLTPDHISRGDKFVCISDSADQKIAFIRIKDGERVEIDLEASPGQIAYRSLKFYVVIGGNTVRIFHEQALAPINDASLIRPVRDMQFDDGRWLHIYTTDPDSNRYYEATIDLNADALDQEEILPDPGFRHARLSPYNYAPFGREYTSDLFLRQKQVFELSGAKIDGISREADDFEVDFFESVIYYQSGDSLYSYGITDGLEHAAYALEGELIKAYFLIDELGP